MIPNAQNCIENDHKTLKYESKHAVYIMSCYFQLTFHFIRFIRNIVRSLVNDNEIFLFLGIFKVYYNVQQDLLNI